MELRRPHPIHILENTTKYFYLLLLPLIRGFLSFRGGLYRWLSGAWFDLLILFAILMMAVLRWAFTRYTFDRNGICINRSFILNQRSYLPYKRLTTVYIEAPLYFRPFRAVRLKADTDGGYLRRTDFSITLSRKEAVALFERAQTVFRENETIKKSYRPQWFYLAILSLITSNTLSGVVFVATLISQSGDLLGKEFEDRLVVTLTDLAQVLAFGLPPAAALLAYILLGGWLISFLMNTVRHIRFHVLRQGKSMEIRTGIFTTRCYAIHTDRINLVELRQSMITKLLGFFTVFIHCSGYGKQKNELSVLIPAADRYEVHRNLKVLLPEFPIIPKQYRPKARALSRFLIPPITAVFCVLALFGTLYLLFPQFRELIFFVGIMAELPTVWWMLVRLFSFFHTGIGKENGIYTFYYTYAYGFFTASVPEERISQLHCRQTLFQRMSHCCDIVILSYSEGRRRLVVPNIPIAEANELFDFCFFDNIHLQKGK